jgi:hypothetical protein
MSRVDLDLNGFQSSIRLAQMEASCERSQIVNELELGIIGSGCVLCGVKLK